MHLEIYFNVLIFHFNTPRLRGKAHPLCPVMHTISTKPSKCTSVKAACLNTSGAALEDHTGSHKAFKAVLDIWVQTSITHSRWSFCTEGGQMKETVMPYSMRQTLQQRWIQWDQIPHITDYIRERPMWILQTVSAKPYCTHLQFLQW